ncbi:hypothetical protein C8250_026925 [Streptomyces sp. So13.3]|uniref:hypothetical protein n=1 Tax=unclassified Streptomyces TaxID=2593676 RepID=UPI00164D5320|nr:MULTISPECIES: hypothetical protein [unclassified Streptomyces]MCM2426476.1 hypothetical protein [Streptomyces sp. RKAG337]QNA75044.1 hypothetical protein C8250_026925 [Streptomyces sp. So13.3]
MSTWAVKRLVAAHVWARQAGERGQTSFEYLGIAVVIAVIIGVLAGTTSIGDAVLTGITGRIAAIVGAGG